MRSWRAATLVRMQRLVRWRSALLLAALLALLWVFVIQWPFTTPVPDTCDTGLAVSDPADHPELVGDCEALLALRDELAGTSTLNWSASLPITSWDGVASDKPRLKTLCE